MRTAVIIPNYNGAKFLDPCMSALKMQTYRDFRVLIVDNGSADGSVEILEKYEREGAADVIYLSENTGFSGAVNAGIEACLSHPDGAPEYIVLLNNDTEPEPGYLTKMAEVLGSDDEKKIGAVTPLMISMHDCTLIDSAGDGYTLCGWAFQRGVGRCTDLKKFDRATDVFSACAGACMYRSEALLKIAFRERDGKSGRWFFDPMHFAYLEDVDVSMRLKIHGYRIMFEPSSRVYHLGSGTSGSKYNEFKVRLASRNNVWLNYKNLPLFMLLIDLPFILSGVVIKQIFFICRGFGRAYLCGFFEGIGRLREARRHKTFFKPSRLANYLLIEWHMITDTFSYLEDLFCRRFLKS